MLKKIYKEPLVAFLFFGGLLYLGYFYLNPNEIDSNDIKTIVINKEILNTQINALNKTKTRASNDSPLLVDQQVKERVIQDYIEQEALFREALDMGLDQDDLIIKRWLIQKLSFLLEDLSTKEIEVNDEKLKNYYEQHAGEYRPATKLSFTHLYLSDDSHGDKTEKKAQNLLTILKKSQLGINDVSDYGDSFPLKKTYADSTPLEIMSHFGSDFSETLFKLDTQDSWQGPVKSGYGYHLVFIVKKEYGDIPEFETIKEKLSQGYQYQEKVKANKRIIERIVKKFNIVRKDI